VVEAAVAVVVAEGAVAEVPGKRAPTTIIEETPA
jgi:hypothetical protein